MPSSRRLETPIARAARAGGPPLPRAGLAHPPPVGGARPPRAVGAQLALLAVTLWASLAALTCAEVARADLPCAPARVLFVVDQSSSMRDPAPGGGTKWDAARAALREIAAELAPTVELGLAVFPHPRACGPGVVVHPIGLTRADALVDALGAPPPRAGNHTPLAETLDALHAHAALFDAAHAAHVVLLTDGWQWCDPHDPSRRFAPVTAAHGLRARGVVVHVVGFGAGVDALTLARAAVAGGSAPPGCDPRLAADAEGERCYHHAHDIAGLRRAFGAVARALTEEVCDGVDNDCDGLVDEGFDRDGDGFTTCGTSPGGTDPAWVDCDDEDPRVFPGARERCNGRDDDCDGSVDAGCACHEGEARECGRVPGACATGRQHCVGGLWSVCEGERGVAEVCNGLDDDCDGVVDEGAECEDGELCLAGACEPLEPPWTGEPAAPEEAPPYAAPSLYGCACDPSGGPPPSGAVGLLWWLLTFRRGSSRRCRTNTSTRRRARPP
ncbi:MAG: VWA domain-containing protein [Myxococcales bacterium]|nr:VWA domain-containing protein [Myxococcales bacterium]